MRQKACPLAHFYSPGAGCFSQHSQHYSPGSTPSLRIARALSSSYQHASVGFCQMVPPLPTSGFHPLAFSSRLAAPMSDKARFLLAGFTSIAVNASHLPSADSPFVNTLSHTNHLQRWLGSRPSGNSSIKNTVRPTAGTQTKEKIHAAASPPGRVPGAASSA